jgi:hypothetical protein
LDTIYFEVVVYDVISHSLIIAEETWEQHQDQDIRDVISLSKLVKKYDGPGEIVDDVI